VFIRGKNKGMTDYKIQMKDVYKSFGDKHVLNGIDLNIEKGTSMVVIGGSGSGKSVTLKCILGLIQPDSGSILIDGQETTNLNEKDRDNLMKKFGMLFQGGALFDSLPVWENVGFGLIHAEGMDKKDAHDIAIEKLKAVGLGSKVADLYPAELSGGMQKRVSLARAIATNPEIIFFDEPTTGLDPIMADVINDLIVKCVKDLGATALTITHDMAAVRKIADNVSMIYEGKIIWSDSIKHLDRSGSAFVDQFIHGRADGPITKNAAHVA
jgi:phospholipid/cholesterol/gamma-HCH transport system ATP-binding protein